MRRIISLVLALLISLSIVIIDNKASYANTDYCINSSIYTGTYDGSTPMEFTINSVNKEDNTFTGHVKINHQLVSIDKDISGSITLNQQNFVCTFGFSFYWLITTYDTTFEITVDPLTGIATGYGGGGVLIAGDVNLTGTINPYYNQSLSYNENDMKMCMDFSYSVYQGDNNDEVKQSVTDCINKYNNQNIDNREIEIHKFGTNSPDSNKDDVAFAILNRKNSDNSIDIIVVIRGTLKDEWQGNVEITGQAYNAEIDVHDSFEKAKDSIKDEISNYYTDYCSNYDKVNLIITGHSRGAATSNLYAKYATDIMGGTLDPYAPEHAYDDIPEFDSVTAYTFACPNNTRITNHHTENYLKGYTNIFNFWFDSDIVPLVPPREPEEGWNYWKYGQCYTMDISDYYKKEKVKYFTDHTVYYEIGINEDIKEELKNAFSQWPSVDDYYNKLYRTKRLTIRKNIADGTEYYALEDEDISLYDFLHSGTSFLGSYKFEGLHAIRYLSKCRHFDPLIVFALSNIYTIKTSHHFNTYNEIINTGNDDFTAFGDSNFSPIYYSSSQNLRNNNSTRKNDENRNNEIIYNSAEVQKLTSMANHSTNNDILEWNYSDPSTWEGVTWNSDGNVTSIDLKYKWLTGTLDCSNFIALTDLNVYGNSFTSLNLSGDTGLLSLNCGFNDFSSNGLSLTDCTSLTDLFCDGCGLTTINLSTLIDLENLSCSFNNLIALDVSYNTSLEHISCIYNYLDISANSTLYTALNGYKTANNAYLNYHPQRITENAIVDGDEMLALKNFANIGDNNQILDWLDENGDISLEKLQYYAIFEFDGTQYRVIALDISNLPVEGTLDLSAFSCLDELYCDESNITSLFVNGCSSLQVLSCYNCDIETLTLPTNVTSSDSPLYSLNCEYNYIDTTMFTQSIIDNISSKDEYLLKYERQKGDNSALKAVVEFTSTLTEESFVLLSDLYKAYENYENFLLTQTEIDSIVTDFLNSISDLEPYLNLKISGNNGTITTVYNNETQSGSSHSLLFGTPVTLTATADEGYIFDGWYEKVTQRKFSSNTTYTFKITTNMDMEARFVRTGDVTLTFTNDTGQIISKIDKSVSEWNEVTGISDLLPEVPYKLGHTSGMWNYTEADVLTALQAGNDVTITPVYDESTYEYPTVPTLTDNVPLLNLYYSLDTDNNVGSFTMAAGIPQDLNIEAIGIGFYYKKAASFNPSNFILNINNKMLTSRFDNTDSDGIYIVNINKFTSSYNWCARGYITYYDENNELKTVYSNQINIVDRNQ